LIWYGVNVQIVDPAELRSALMDLLDGVLK
jgi:hypothetical protein